MCGIAGIVQFNGAPVSAQTLEGMASALIHRGPDDAGIWTAGNVGLSHRRLSVIDIKGGHQPMADQEGQTIVCFNGEIYNHMQLRQKLESRGLVFRTHCDTEVLIHLYNEYGSDMLPQLNGMFAFAVVDLRRRQLLLARDRLGQKPLFYYSSSHCLAFASELQALRRGPEFPDEIQPQSVHDYLTFQYVPAPHTIFKGVKKLMPATALTARLEKADSQRTTDYWRPEWREKTRESFSDCTQRLKELVQTAVQRRMIADVPLGAFLSGGLDSSIVAGVMSSISETPVQTFTIGFSHARYDERKFAALAAEAFGTKHHEQEVDPADFDVLRMLVKHCGEPYADSSILPTYLLSHFTRRHVTVALSGDGADELFGGYWRYVLIRFSRALDAAPPKMRRAIAQQLSAAIGEGINERTLRGKIQRLCRIAAASSSERYLSIISRTSEMQKLSLYGPRLQNRTFCPSNNSLQETLAEVILQRGEKESALDLVTYLPSDILTKVDIASMASSLEVRSPFLDPDVVEFATSLPWQYKQCGPKRKRILHAAFKDILPAGLQKRGKMGFGVPVADWFRTSWHQRLREVLLSERADRRGFFRHNAVKQLISEHHAGRQDHSYLLWSLLVFELWCDEFNVS